MTAVSNRHGFLSNKPLVETRGFFVATAAIGAANKPAIMSCKTSVDGFRTSCPESMLQHVLGHPGPPQKNSLKAGLRAWGSALTGVKKPAPPRERWGRFKISIGVVRQLSLADFQTHFRRM